MQMQRKFQGKPKMLRPNLSSTNLVSDSDTNTSPQLIKDVFACCFLIF
jgi:hypothetical protein